MADGPAAARAHGRGARSNRDGRFEALRTQAVNDGWDGRNQDEDTPPPLKTVVMVERPRSIITRNQSPDIAFDRSINPYRGCEHGCVYCFARPTHAYLGLSPGLDFESRLFAKPEAPDLLRRELAKKSYRPKVIAIGTNTDPYQPIEKHQRIMRGILEVLAQCRHPVSILTKSHMVVRDLDLLVPMAQQGLVRVALSITTLDHRLARALEPRASTPRRRLDALKQLSDAGVPTGLMFAPVIPAVNDQEMEAVLSAAARAGIEEAGYVTLRLPLEIKDLFGEWLSAHMPDRARRVMRLVKELRGGRLYDPRFGHRFSNHGAYGTLIAQRFERLARQYDLNRQQRRYPTDLFTPPRLDQEGGDDRQFDLFAEG